ncbi:MAG TPA: hypothetical protein VK171_01760 [Fimbriimonas sp.]|nr:hypothetical protein [Fimbriimonas sp.]
MVKNFAGIAVASAALIGGIVLATSSKAPKTTVEPIQAAVKESAPKPDSTTQPALPHDKDVRTYLKSVGSFMEAPPTDGNFGGARVPTIHGKDHESIPGYAQVKSFGTKMDFVAGSLGMWPAAKGEVAKPRFRIIHRVNDNGKSKLFSAVRYNDIMAEVSKVAALPTDSNGYSTGVSTLEKSKVNIMTHIVKAPDDSCAKCHAGKTKDSTVGHVYAIYANLK